MPNQKRPSTTAQADRVDYLMSVLCVLTILDILTLPLTAIVGIFWVKQYELPMMGEGFSTKINGKKLGQFALLLLSGAALGAFALSATQGLAVVLEQRLPGTLFVMGAGHALWQDLLVAVVTAFVMELAFRRCLFFEWSRYGILPAIIGSGLITMLLTPLPQWPGALVCRSRLPGNRLSCDDQRLSHGISGGTDAAAARTQSAAGAFCGCDGPAAGSGAGWLLGSAGSFSKR